jgi:hypothetical protein
MGEREVPMSTLIKLTRIFDVNITFFFDEVHSEPDSHWHPLSGYITMQARKSNVEVRLRQVITEQLLLSEHDYIHFKEEGYGEGEYHTLKEDEGFGAFTAFVHKINKESTEILLDRFFSKSYDNTELFLENAGFTIEGERIDH